MAKKKTAAKRVTAPRAKKSLLKDVEAKKSRELTPAPMSAGPFKEGVDLSGLPVDNRPVPTAKDILEGYFGKPQEEPCNDGSASGDTSVIAGESSKPLTPEATEPSGAAPTALRDARSDVDLLLGD